MLRLAGGTGVVGLIAASIAMTLGIVVAVQPPGPHVASPEQSQGIANVIWLQLVMAVLTVIAAVFVMRQIVLRRPMRKLKSLKPASRRNLYVTSVFAIVMVAICATGVTAATLSIRADRSRHLTDNLAFAMLCFPLTMTSNMFLMLSNAAFLLWWKGDIEDARPAGVPSVDSV